MACTVKPQIINIGKRRKIVDPHRGEDPRYQCPEVGCDFSKTYCDTHGGADRARAEVRAHRRLKHKCTLPSLEV